MVAGSRLWPQLPCQQYKFCCKSVGTKEREGVGTMYSAIGRFEYRSENFRSRRRQKGKLPLNFRCSRHVLSLSHWACLCKVSYACASFSSFSQHIQVYRKVLEPFLKEDERLESDRDDQYKVTRREKCIEKWEKVLWFLDECGT